MRTEFLVIKFYTEIIFKVIYLPIIYVITKILIIN